MKDRDGKKTQVLCSSCGNLFFSGEKIKIKSEFVSPGI